MKKLVSLLVCFFTLQTVARIDDGKSIQIAQIPQSVQQLIKQYFADSKVASAKMESDFSYKSHEVTLMNGDKVELGSKGNWEEVNYKYSSVLTAIIPAAIQKYVTTSYPDAKILEIERDKKDYEVELSNRTELKFDLKFNLTDIDF